MHSSSLSGSSAQLSQQAAFKCTNRDVSSKTKNYLLSKAQYINSLEDLFGTGVLTAVASPMSTLGSDTNSAVDYQRTSSVSPAQAVAQFDVAEAVAAYVLSSTTRTADVFGACANTVSPAASCIDTYLNGQARRIYRRPLSTSEIAFAKTKVMATAGPYKENLRALLMHHLISPAFLWTLEMGTGSSSTQRLTLTPYEVASRLAFQITDSTPDLELMSSAANLTIMTPVGLAAQVNRLLVSPRGKQKIAQSLLRWALSDQASDISALPATLVSGIQTSGLQNAMTAEAQTFVNHIVFNLKGSLKDLLTSKLSFASHPGLANIYGHSPISGNNPVEMTQRRQGLLLRAPFLTWFTPRTNIILRGVGFQKRVLCNVIPSPNVDIVGDRDGHVFTEQELLSVTNRAAVSYQTDNNLCMSCHKVINPTGFAFEGFDSLGRIRSQEQIYDKSNNFVRSLPIQTNTEVPMPDGGYVGVSDAYDFVTTLAQSPETAACVTRNMYRYFLEKRETPEDDCQLQDGFDIVKDANQPILKSIEKLFTSQTIYFKEI